MKTKSLLTIFIITLFLILLGTTQSNASLYLDNLDFNVQINEDGSMKVVETWDIDISDTNTLYKTFKIDKSKYSALTDISLKEITGGMNKDFRETYSWKYHLDKGYYFGGINNDNEYEIAWGVDISSSTNKKYQITYTVADAVRKYRDCNELYWQFIGDQFEVDAKKVTGTIKLPQRVESKEELKIWGHTEYLNGEIYAINEDTIKFNLNNYRAGKFVEVRILMPTYVMENLHYTSLENKTEEITNAEEKWASEANAKRAARDRNMKTTMICITVINSLIGLVFIIGITKKIEELKNNPKIKREIKLDYYRELPDETATPVEGTFVLNGGFKTPDAMSATILNLTLKKHIKIEQQEEKIIITIINTNKDGLKKDERITLELIERVCEIVENDKVDMEQIVDYIKEFPNIFEDIDKTFMKAAKENSEKKGKYSKEKAKKSAKYGAKITGYISLIIIIALVTIISCAITGVYAQKTIKYAFIAGAFSIGILVINIILALNLIIKLKNGFTAKGINEREQWKAFKKYMEDFSLLDEKEVPHLVLWEKYLVFATAFGISNKVIKQLKIKYPELNEQSTLDDMILFSAMSSSTGLNTNFISSLNTSTSNMYSASTYSSTYSSGSGAGGGFSGGGGGGGRRRPDGGGR